MKKIIFNLRLENKVLQSQNADLKISPVFTQSEVNELIRENLSPLAFSADLNTLSYVIKEDQLYVEGTAYENRKTPTTDFLISD